MKKPLEILRRQDAVVELGLQRAAQLIESVKVPVVVDGVELIAPKFLANPANAGSAGYIAVEKVKQQPIMAHVVLLDEISRIETSIRTALAIAGALDIVPEFNEMLATIMNIRERRKSS